MRILGLDYGSKTVGVAVSDPLGITAQGVSTIWRKQENEASPDTCPDRETCGGLPGGTDCTWIS